MTQTLSPGAILALLLTAVVLVLVSQNIVGFFRHVSRLRVNRTREIRVSARTSDKHPVEVALLATVDITNTTVEADRGWETGIDSHLPGPIRGWAGTKTLAALHREQGTNIALPGRAICDLLACTYGASVTSVVLKEVIDKTPPKAPKPKDSPKKGKEKKK